ncbi:hypothetical protein CAEBREN_04471 [Caenorhabditis brenneri]|uniref:Uncharacterized protein n=1 Tax=Caenorhabditis brenneri TaxID=135651 RepID=G0MBE1_CAEBE|nr:hypothetical protein CAEBREN_04471 [Caenorhabditis brenneri]
MRVCSESSDTSSCDEDTDQPTCSNPRPHDRTPTPIHHVYRPSQSTLERVREHDRKLTWKRLAKIKHTEIADISSDDTVYGVTERNLRKCRRYNKKKAVKEQIDNGKEWKGLSAEEKEAKKNSSVPSGASTSNADAALEQKRRVKKQRRLRYLKKRLDFDETVQAALREMPDMFADVSSDDSSGSDCQPEPTLFLKRKREPDSSDDSGPDDFRVPNRNWVSQRS